jgi:hypothetical protein
VKKIAILQSNYIPWKGYFDLIASVDEFILYDDMQFTKNDWRNRNLIKTPQGVQWLSVPVGKGINRRIRDVTLDQRWQIKHWKSLEMNYRRAPHFAEIAEWLGPIYLSESYLELSGLNRRLIEAVCQYLGIKTVIKNSWDYILGDGKTDRLASLCIQAGGTEYISGPSARGYIDEGVFSASGINLRWFDYVGYPEYPQLWGGFIHAVSILDLLFNCGKSSHIYMRCVR